MRNGISHRALRRLAVLAAGTGLLVLTVSIQPGLAKDKPPPDIKTETTVNVVPGISQATYSGRLTTRPERRGRTKKEKAQRRRWADDCLEGRTVVLYHGTFLIAQILTDNLGDWTVQGNKPPTGDHIEVSVLPRPVGKENDGRDCDRADLTIISP